MSAAQPGADRLAQGDAVGSAPVIGASCALLTGGGLEDHGGGHEAAPLLVGQADDAGLSDTIDAGEGFLDMAGLDLEAAGDDDVVQAPQDLQSPVGAQASAVGGGQDASAGAVLEGLADVVGRAVNGLQVALRQDRTGDEDAADPIGIRVPDGRRPGDGRRSRRPRRSHTCRRWSPR